MVEGGQQVFESLDRFETDSKWFYENIEFLRKSNLTGKFVAVKNQKVIASDDKIETVIRYAESEGENPAYLVIEFVYPEKTVILL
jgi:hypothetical protein